MKNEYYKVLCGDIVIADHMTLETACILVKALFEQYWQELTLHYTIQKMIDYREACSGDTN